MSILPAFSTPRTHVYFVSQPFAEELYYYINRNIEFLTPFEPARESDYYLLSSVKHRIQLAMDNQSELKAVSLLITPRDSQTVIGTINFSNFVFGVFQACHVGYSMDEAYQGRGIMTEVLKMSLPYLHHKYGLRRFMANYMPDNIASGRALEKAGFEREGYAKSYLKINGEWRDHVLTAFVFDDEK